jgi:hypothetical protein
MPSPASGVPGNNSDIGSTGLTWTITSPPRTASDDGDHDQAQQIANGTSGTHLLYLQSYSGLSGIPAGATITKVTLALKRYTAAVQATGYVRDATIQQLIGGAPSGSNLADTVNDWPTSATSKNYEFITGLPTRDQIVASTYGMCIAANVTKTVGAGSVNARLVYAPISVDYTEASSGRPRRATGLLLCREWLEWLRELRQSRRRIFAPGCAFFARG